LFYERKKIKGDKQLTAEKGLTKVFTR